MNFGRLNNIINDIQLELKTFMADNNKHEDQLFEKSTINIFIVNLYPIIKNKYPEVTFSDIENIFTRFFSIRYIFNNNLDFSNGMKCFRDLDTKFSIDEVNTKVINVPKKYKKLEKHFQELFHTPQPEQRTKEWYEFRHLRVTASDTATAVDLNPYEPYQNFIVKKCDPNYPFHDNIHCHHGKKYEPTATMIYEHIYNNKVTEFGCLPSKKYSMLAASPDGICSKSTLDGQFSERLGTMLEIKCPVTRQIKTKGKLCGEICPFYYYCQIQQQLLCCELETCDFWQCKILEYESREEYLKDTNLKSRFTEGDHDTERPINPLITKGCIIQLLPINYELDPTNKDDRQEFKAKFMYPPRLDLTIEEYDGWCVDAISNWKIYHPEWADNHYVDRIIYWYSPMSHNVEVVKREKWFLDNIYSVLKKTWDKVDYYRSHLNEVEFLKKTVIKRKKWFKYNSEFYINKGPNGQDLIKDKVLFLNDINFNEDSNEIPVTEDLFVD